MFRKTVTLAIEDASTAMRDLLNSNCDGIPLFVAGMLYQDARKASRTLDEAKSIIAGNDPSEVFSRRSVRKSKVSAE